MGRDRDSSFANVELATVLLVWSNLNQYAGGQLCNETSPYDDCSMDEG